MPQKVSPYLKFSVVGLLLLVLLGGVFGIGVFIGMERRPAIERVFGVSGKESAGTEKVDFSLFWEAWVELKDKFVDAKKIDAQKQVYGAISGMVRPLEPRGPAGSPAVTIRPDRWTAVTADGSCAAHFEHCVAVTKNGPWILTEP